MKKIDSNGLLLASLQAKIFEESLLKVKTSSEIFIRRFMHSKIATYFDSTSFLDSPNSLDYVFEELEEEYGKSEYGKVKYNQDVLFWIGYIYRYFCYTYNISSKQAYKIVKPKELNQLYYSYHSLDCSLAIDRILEAKNISFEEKEINKKLLSLIRKRKYIEGISLINYYSKEINIFNSRKINNDSLIIDEEINEINSKILLSIVYHDEIIGLVILKNIDNSSCEIEITINEESNKNKDIYEVLLIKAIDYVKKNLKLSSLSAVILRNNDQVIDAYKKTGFEYVNEDEFFVYLRKRIA
ncbi:MAG: GNAT family N-acetyltransferase [Bacillales bacterium]|nr:GNAT family N-acetyltransferase [Bacillales bacterium]